MKVKFSTKELVRAGLFLALALLMPFVTAQIPEIGSAMLPMHIPVLLCGFVCSPLAVLVVGAAAPLLRNLMFGMPPLFPTAIAMAFELATYGFLAAVAYRRLKKTPYRPVLSLLISMVGGRIVWGVVSLVLYTAAGMEFTWQVFAAGAVLNAIPGIVIQIILIPIVIAALERAGFIGKD